MGLLAILEDDSCLHWEICIKVRLLGKFEKFSYVIDDSWLLGLDAACDVVVSEPATTT
jgi:hypothetical protein